jgi:gamma-glutamylaminecyclotransferase
MEDLVIVVENKDIKIFVYGTLKRNKQFNYIMKRAKFIGEAETIEKYALYFDHIPYMVKNEKISNVKGEVYEVTSDLLKLIDDFEEHPDYYKREEIRVKLENGDIISVWAYLFPEKRGNLIESGEF